MSYFRFQEIKESRVMRDLMALRYRVYSVTRGLRKFDSLDHLARLEGDSFDVFSRHYGLYAAARTSEKLIGGIRLTGLAKSAQAGAIQGAFEEPALAERVVQPPPTRLPMGAYHPDWARIDEDVRGAIGRGERVVEPGRLILEPSWRGGSRHLARFLIESTIAVWLGEGIENAVLTCSQLHAPMYASYGFRPLPGVRDYDFMGDGCTYASLWLRAENLPAEARERCSCLAERFCRDGEVRLDLNGIRGPLRSTEHPERAADVAA